MSHDAFALFDRRSKQIKKKTNLLSSEHDTTDLTYMHEGTLPAAAEDERSSNKDEGLASPAWLHGSKAKNAARMGSSGLRKLGL